MPWQTMLPAGITQIYRIWKWNSVVAAKTQVNIAKEQIAPQYKQLTF